MIGGERSLPFATCFNVNVIIPLMDIKFGKQSGLSEAIDNVGCQREGIMVFDYEVNESVIVLN